MSKMKKLITWVPDDGKDGIFWLNGERWIRENGVETRLLDLAPNLERDYLRMMEFSQIEFKDETNEKRKDK